MNVTRKTSQRYHSEQRQCPNCNRVLPPHALFCGACGKRVALNPYTMLNKETDINERYRIMSLIRRHSCVQLLLATDTQSRHPVLIRDIDITSLPEQLRQRALTALQQEYDLLHRQRMPDVMPLIDLRRFKGHLYSVAEWPFAFDHQRTHKQPVYTLDDLLQSGIGLPGEEIALAWIERLAHTVTLLHDQRIVLGDLDPSTIIVSGDNYHSIPALAVFWLPRQIRPLLSHTLAQPNYFIAPEAQQGYAESRSDIYSLGAILYLLLTGMPPDIDQRKNAIQTPREIDSHISSGLDELVMRALDMDPMARFATPIELADALRHYAEEAIFQQATRSFSLFKGKREGFTGKLTTKHSTRVLKETLAGASQLPRKVFAAEQEQQSTPGQPPSTPSIEDIKTVIIKTRDLDPIIAREGHARSQQKKQEEPAVAPEDETPTAPQNNELPVEQEQAATLETEASQADSTTDASSSQQAEMQQFSDTPTQKEAAAAPEAQEQKQPAIEDIQTVKVSIEEIGAQGGAHLMTTSTRDTVNKESANIQTEEEQAVSQQRQESSADTEKAPALSGEEPPADSQIRSFPPADVRPPQEPEAPPLAAQMKKLLTGPLPALPRLWQRPGPLVVQKSTSPAPVAPLPENQLVDRLRRFVLGQQQYNITAAALIETPLRVQPHQNYTMRIQIMGRDTSPNPGVGLSGLVKGEPVHIEVRSALYHKYAYIVQQADVTLPGLGYAAAITIPLQPLSDGPSGRRERLHIHFMDEQRNPLYEKPFAVEIFISPLVHAGREGHNVLPIPL